MFYIHNYLFPHKQAKEEYTYFHLKQEYTYFRLQLEYDYFCTFIYYTQIISGGLIILRKKLKVKKTTHCCHSFIAF